MNKDGREDFFLCEFGNYTGQLSILEGEEHGSFKKHIINPLPGAIKTEIHDFNKDGLKDFIVLMAQGDEKLSLYMNKGNMEFEEKILARFPPVYGLNYFETADFNNDGHLDILCTNGDNADYSPIVKPYHAVRIFENDSKNNFKEVWTYPLSGASKAMATDFDKDGDIDLFLPEKRKCQSSCQLKKASFNTQALFELKNLV